MNKMNLSEIADVNMGSSPDSTFVNEEYKGYPFLQGCAEFGERRPNPKYYTPRPSKLSSPNDILISVRAPVGELNIGDTTYCIGRGVAAISGKKNKVDGTYLYYKLLQYRPDLERVSQGSTFDAAIPHLIQNCSQAERTKN
ncbi:MAG: restriction endonuclease subunit S [Phaeodactylibacter sp.]|nr:restriction endonuclease subunit S [Phaeodactylibacter sp.]